MLSFNSLLLQNWFSCETTSQHKKILINRHDLDFGAVVALARYGATVQLDAAALKHVEEAVEVIQTSIDKGLVVYGVNTGFGGSADTRTDKVTHLQRELIHMLNCGILPSPSRAVPSGQNGHVNGNVSAHAEPLPLSDFDESLCLPESWVRASMLVRLTSLFKGTSGVRASTLITLGDLLTENITPQIPLRGSISASGDLSPLSYIVSAMMGKRSSSVWIRDHATGARRLVPAAKALEDKGVTPVDLDAKEGLALVNGTAVSAGVAALAVYETIMQVSLAQILTAMSVEALKGSDESFDPFMAKVRPHPGQIQSAENIFAFLKGSKLLRIDDGTDQGKLRQDRYSIRTASQWIGPCIEDVQLAASQVSVELNSITDNPLVNTETGQILHGGNFQAKAITNAMEKLRQACQSIGRMLFAQCSELINPATNFGLPPNLVIDNPSESFLWKGTDIMMAALQSELGFLANPVGSHVQTAEMSNQALNSLALISARYTLMALDVVTQMTAAYLVATCQALDLRVIHIQMLERLREKFDEETTASFRRFLSHEMLLEVLRKAWVVLQVNLDKNSTLDIEDRFAAAFTACQPLLVDVCPSDKVVAGEMLGEVHVWTRKMGKIALTTFDTTLRQYQQGAASPYLGKASRRLYLYIRKQLRIPFLSNLEKDSLNGSASNEKHQSWTERPTIGSYNSRVYHKMRSGELYAEVVAVVADLEHEHNDKKRKA